MANDPVHAATVATVATEWTTASTLHTVADAAAAAPKPSSAQGPLTPGQPFGDRYHIIKVLGVGGMGAVYQALDNELNVGVALKVIRIDPRQGGASEAEKLFKNELLLARQVTHKNVVRIHDLGDIDGIKYITMPYIKGDDLTTVLRRDGRLPIDRALKLARQIAAGLEAAHEAGVVHRDLKPSNVMLGADDQAQIMDFGISASAGAGAGGAVTGTPEYMAPEQFAGIAVDARADIYAYGLILLELLTGLRQNASMKAQDRLDAMQRRFDEGVPSVRTIDNTIPAALDAVVARCVERDPAARFQTTTELRAALDALDDAGEPIPVARRLTTPMIAAAVILVIALTGGTYEITRRASAPPPQHDPVSVVIADLQNRTTDPTLDHTLEPMLKLALEGAGFISAYDHSVISRSLGVKPPDQFDEAAARELALKQGLGVVVSGALERQGERYRVSFKALQAVTGNVITTATAQASDKNQVLATATNLATRVRQALGDNTSDSAQRFAMETLSATSLDSVRDYATGQEAASNGRFDDARASFEKAVQRDPKFGLGWAALAMAARNLDRQQDAEGYIKEAVRHLDSMTERERYRTRGNFYTITGDYQQCVKEYGDLLARYAADAAAGNNLALCLSYLRNMPKALAQMRQVVKILPKRALYRTNLALYADYASDFQTAAQEAGAMTEPGVFGTIARAFAQVGQGQTSEAADTYRALGMIDAQGASYAASGLGDLASFQGHFADAAKILTDGATADLASKDGERAASKFAALAYVNLQRRQMRAAAAAADKALANSSAVKIRFLAARVFVQTGDVAKARPLIAGLASALEAEPQAYAKIIEGEAALQQGDPRQAIKVLTEANTLLDTWMGHYDLGRAFFAADQFIPADSEFDRCIKRRGEAVALFLDEEPSYGYMPSVYYYQGRVREALGSAGFAESYRAYLGIRGDSKEDPLLPEVRRRAGA
jgi:serine/threonine protein kinase/tetratricopeptide (TPR) repeat protein